MRLIGVMSDSHDDLDGIRRAVAFFNSRNTGIVIHAGDIISPFTVDEFKKLNCKFKAVFGNNDGERKGLNDRFSAMGVELRDMLELEYGGVKLCVYHGTYEGIVQALVESQRYDVVISGHTHKPDITMRDRTLLINPGEVCGYLGGKKTVALLNTGEMSAKVYEI